MRVRVPRRHCRHCDSRGKQSFVSYSQCLDHKQGTDLLLSRGTCLIVFTCLYIAFFAATWGPAAWVVTGEIYPLPIRAKGVALATASNWLWNCIIAVITPYMVDSAYGNLKTKVFFVWGCALFLCLLFAFFVIPETKGLSLEQVDKMLEESTPMTSAKWKPHDTFAHEMGMTTEKGEATTIHAEEHKATGAELAEGF